MEQSLGGGFFQPQVRGGWNMYRVLIVDDEIMIRRGLSKIIKWEQIGFELAGAVGDAQEALKLFQDACPDAEVTLLPGGQPVYYYLISAE